VDKLVVDKLAARIKVPRVSLVFSEQAHNVAYWHFASIRHHALNGRFWSNSGHWSAPALNASVAFDPQRTLAVHCGNGFNAGFNPIKLSV
jgi:hypothetical protein